MVIVWLLCIILTSAGVLSSNNNGFGYFARTDTKITVIYEAPWARMPYPGKGRHNYQIFILFSCFEFVTYVTFSICCGQLCHEVNYVG